MVDNFFKKYGHILLWFIFMIFMIISILRLVTQGIGYALVVFIPSVILLCPPIIKFIQKKTRVKKVILAGGTAIVMLFALLVTTHFSSAQKEENIKINQEKKKEEQERKAEERASEEQKKKEEENKLQIPSAAPKIDSKSKKEQDDLDSKLTENIKDNKTQNQMQQQVQTKKVAVRASKKSGRYYTPDHPSYNQVAPKNIVIFNSEEAATKAGYKKAA